MPFLEAGQLEIEGFLALLKSRLYCLRHSTVMVGIIIPTMTVNIINGATDRPFEAYSQHLEFLQKMSVRFGPIVPCSGEPRQTA